MPDHQHLPHHLEPLIEDRVGLHLPIKPNGIGSAVAKLVLLLGSAAFFLHLGLSVEGDEEHLLLRKLLRFPLLGSAVLFCALSFQCS